LFIEMVSCRVMPSAVTSTRLEKLCATWVPGCSLFFEIDQLDQQAASDSGAGAVRWSIRRRQQE
jgi:hypothetical protein